MAPAPLRPPLVLLALGLFLTCPGPAAPRAAGAVGEDQDDRQTVRAAGVGTDGPDLLAFFRARAGGAVTSPAARDLVRRLGDADFAVRERAAADLVRLGPAAEPCLRSAAGDPDAEVRRRAGDCLRDLDAAGRPRVLVAAARLLAASRPPATADVLLAYLPQAPDETVAGAVQDALAAVAHGDGPARQSLVAALAGACPARRAGAAAALLGTRGAEARAAVRPLLRDRDAGVRRAAALGLAGAGERAAVTVLIDLLTALPADQAWGVEEALATLAGDAAPRAGLGTAPAEREACRRAWARWWQEHAATADLARLADASTGCGLTLVLQDCNRLVEYDREGRVRRQIDGLRLPVEAQWLPGQRVLIAEYSARRVTERAWAGQVLWEFLAPGPVISAQRLPGGNTLVACRQVILEVDPGGRAVRSVARPTPDVAAARQLADGSLVVVTARGTCLRLDARGAEVASFPVGRSIGCLSGVAIRPDGGVLVPQVADDRVVEYDARGAVAWEASAARPWSAWRLANGHVLVSSAQNQQVVELDRAGRTVSVQKVDGRPTRASRR